MRKVLITALGIASLGALAGVQQVRAATVTSIVNNCTKTCNADTSHPIGRSCNHVHGTETCINRYSWKCVTSCQAGPVSQSPGPVQTIQQQKTKYQR